MNIVVLGPDRPNIMTFLADAGESIIRTEEKLTPSSAELADIDWLISYGYRHIIKPAMIERFSKRIVNLHISYLPWNRGADPNLWSCLEDTPRGVTIHYLDAGLDTGEIIAQRRVPWCEGDTLRSSYERLSEEIERLFMELWPRLRVGRMASRPQPDGGSMHRVKDKAAFEHLLRLGWDTPVSELLGRARQEVRL